MRPNVIYSLALILIVTSCNPFATPAEPVATVAALQFVTPTPHAPAITNTLIISSTPTLTPTHTPSPAATNTPTNTPTVTPTPNLTPHAVINSPGGSLNVRSGPGGIYNPPLGTYNNGAQVDILGRQKDISGDLWWLIPFASISGDKGWIYAQYTEAQNIANLPWVNAPATPTPVIPPTVANTKPQAIINNPAGFVQVKRGPGDEYDPPWGAYNNGAVVELLGKQYASNGELWWLIPFEISPTGQGWVNSRYTQANNNANTVPWVNLSTQPGNPLPIDTPVYGGQPTPIYSTPIPPQQGQVDWAIAGRVVDSVTGRPLAGVSVQARLGVDNASRAATTNAQGEFSILGLARDQGDLLLTITASGYLENSFNAGFSTGRQYYFDRLTLKPMTTNQPTVSWTLAGRVSELNTNRPIANAQVQAMLGADAVKVITMTNGMGEFNLTGLARDNGSLQITVSATGYQTSSFTPNPTTGRNYTLFDLQLTPSTTDCVYDNVIGLPQDWAMARLQTLGFTQIRTQAVSVGSDTSKIDQVTAQIPEPPASADQTMPLGCDLPIILSVGLE